MYAYPYQSNPSWRDVTPLPEPEFSASVVRIAAPPKFTETLAYFRAIVAADELSPRALALTADVIELNPANYTAWQYRLRCITALNASLTEELAFTLAVAEENPKCYQVWQHRRAVTALIGAAGDELAATARYLREDTKNYHAWSYRQWLLRAFGNATLWTADLRDTADLLVALDVRNNSLWNQRAFLLTRCFPGALSVPAVVRAEVKFTLACIHRAALNESAWVYLDGLVRAPGFRDWRPVARAALAASAQPALGVRAPHKRVAHDIPVPPPQSTAAQSNAQSNSANGGAGPTSAEVGRPPCNRYAHATLLELLLSPRCPALDLAALASESGGAAVELTFPGAGFAGPADCDRDATAAEVAAIYCSDSAAADTADPTAAAAAAAAALSARVAAAAALEPAPAAAAPGLPALALLSRALEQCDALSAGDSVRARYWAYRRAQIAAVAAAERAGFARAPADGAERAAADWARAEAEAKAEAEADMTSDDDDGGAEGGDITADDSEEEAK